MSLRDIAAGLVWLGLLGGFAMLAWFTAGGVAVSWVLHPWAAAALTLSHAVAFGTGLWVRGRRRDVVAEQYRFLDEDLEAKKLADAAHDGQHVNTAEVPLFGVAPQRPVALYDQDADPWQPAAKGRWLS
jgi:hypothetical protein